MKNLARLLMLAAISIVGTTSLHAATVYVGTCGGSPHYATIQLAVTNSQPGGTVLVCPGTYHEQVLINKNLTLSGTNAGNADQVVITSPGGGVSMNTRDLYVDPMYGAFPVAAQVLVQNAQNVSLSNITVDGTGNGINGCSPDIRGIYYQNAGGSIENVVTRNQTLVPAASLNGCQSGQGIFIQGGYGNTQKQNITIQNNSVHNFQKNGITADGNTLNVMIMNNFIAGQGPTTGAAENGIQISSGATGKIQNNTTTDEIWAPDTSSQPYNAAAGIIIVGSENVEVSNNTIGSTQFAIVTDTYSGFNSPGNPNGLADKNNIHNNLILNTMIFDAIDVCSNNNQVQNNMIYNSTESGIHLDSTCVGTGTNNNVAGNTINEACAGILQGATPNQINNNNMYFNDVSEVVAGDVCPVAATPSVVSNAAVISLSGGTGSASSPLRISPVQ